MKKFFLPTLLVAFLGTQATTAFAQKNPFVGRWDLIVTPANGNPYPQWMEITETNGKLEGRFQPRGGAWKPFIAAKSDNAHVILTLTDATQKAGANYANSSPHAHSMASLSRRGHPRWSMSI